jgi:hypothetical protein
MRKMNKVIVFVCLLFFPVVCFSQDCKSLKEQIKEKIEFANYCNTDEDCIIKYFGCPFGCGSYLNKDVNLNEIQKDIETFQSCPESQCMYKCGNLPKPVCINRKCRIPPREQGKQHDLSL